MVKLTPEGTVADLKKFIETKPINPHQVLSIKSKGSRLVITERFKDIYGNTLTRQGIYNKRLKMSNFMQEALKTKIIKRERK